MKYKVSFEGELLKNPYKGLYIALEGIDGSGKTTQAQELKKYFESKGRKVLVSAEPTRKGEIGELIHKILKGEFKIPVILHQYLFCVDRGLHQQKVIIPALKKGTVVISDRSLWSALAYGLLDKEDVDGKLKSRDQLLVALSILSMYHQFMAPDITVNLELDVDTAMDRLSKLGRKPEFYENKAAITRVKKVYDFIENEFKDQFVPIDGDQDIESVTAKIAEAASRIK